MRDIKEYKHQEFEGFLHPSPKSRDLWGYILKKLKPKSVIDPFIGSGTTAEMCEKLGIKWLGYEIKEEYSKDINKRLKNVKVEPKQIEMEAFLCPPNEENQKTI